MRAKAIFFSRLQSGIDVPASSALCCSGVGGVDGLKMGISETCRTHCYRLGVVDASGSRKLHNSRYLNPVFRSIDPQHPALPARRNDQHGIRGIDHQPSGEPALRQEATNAVDASRCAPATADPHESSQRRTGRCVPALAPEISPAAPNPDAKSEGGLTPRVAAALLDSARCPA
jgi:hypothetical protein